MEELMFPVRKGTPVQCYKDGEKIGEKTPQEWAKELGIRPQSVYDSKFKGTLVQGHYKFYAVGVDPDEPPKPATLSEKNAEAKAQGKTYAQLQMEETLEMVRTPKPQPETAVTLGRLADMIDCVCTLDVREHDEFDAEHVLFTASNDSKVLKIAEIRDMAVDFFLIDWTMQTVRVYVK